jgi:microcystin-dependent protein
LFATTREPLYGTPGSLTGLGQGTVASAGGSQPHSNMQPYLCINFIISQFGIFPSPA